MIVLDVITLVTNITQPHHPHTLHPQRQYSDQKTVFEGIEFYIPQLAHMIIHLEVDWPTAALEQFVLIVCQHR